MREILFRGKAKAGLHAGRFVFGCLLKDFWHPGSCGIRPTDEDLGGYVEVDPETVGQYIGLTDANGAKIFEGDILVYKDYNGHEYPSGVVTYGRFNCSCCDGVYGWYLTENGDIRDLDRGSTCCHIVGNIHDQAET